VRLPKTGRPQRSSQPPTRRQRVPYTKNITFLILEETDRKKCLLPRNFANRTVFALRRVCRGALAKPPRMSERNPVDDAPRTERNECTFVRNSFTPPKKKGKRPGTPGPTRHRRAPRKPLPPRGRAHPAYSQQQILPFLNRAGPSSSPASFLGAVSGLERKTTLKNLIRRTATAKPLLCAQSLFKYRTRCLLKGKSSENGKKPCIAF